MTAGCPDTTGYGLERARELLAEAGVAAVTEQRVGPAPEACEGARRFVVRQRRLPGGEIALTVAGEWRAPLDRESEA